MSTPTETGDLFRDRLGGILSSTFTAASIGLGGELGLFDALAGIDEPRTSQEIADATGYRERYVRAWLQSMVVGDIVQYDADKETYFLPRHRIPYLAGEIKTNMAPPFQMALALTERYQTLLSCFKPDGPAGIDADVFNYHEAKRKMNNGWYTPEYMSGLISQVPGLVKKLEEGIQVCDFGCGRGHCTFMIAEMYPNSTVYGSDVVPELIAQNKADAEKRGLKNIFFEVADLQSLSSEHTNKWDYVTTFDVIHDLPYPDQALKELYRCLKPGGYYSLIDINLHSKLEQNMQSPVRFLTYFANLFYCMPISLFFKNGQGLGTTWGKELAAKMVNQAGFKDVKIFTEDGHLNFHDVCLK